MWVETNHVTLHSCQRIEGKIDTTIYCPVSFVLKFVILSSSSHFFSFPQVKWGKAIWYSWIWEIRGSEESLKRNDLYVIALPSREITTS